MKLIDIHTHHPGVISVISILNVFADRTSPYETGNLGFYSCGLHPWYIPTGKHLDECLKNLDELSYQENCIAIGETGLDKQAEASFDIQKMVFQHHIQLSEKKGKPLIIHCVGAYNEILKLRKEMKVAGIWIFHGFNSSLEMATDLINSGCMLSFGFRALDAKTKANKIITEIPIEHFFLETDDSDQSIEILYAQISEMKGITMDEMAVKMTSKFKRVFKSGR